MLKRKCNQVVKIEQIDHMMMNITLSFFLLMLRLTAASRSSSSHILSVHQNISDVGGQTIVSGNAKFELGFFSPGNSRNRYLGIWFKNTTSQTVAWVANRENPLTDNSGALRLDSQGTHLSLVDGSNKLIWVSNSSSSAASSSSTNMINLIAQLMDSGNLVIKNGNNVTTTTTTTNNNQLEAGFIWQSFDYPGDTFLEGMKLGRNFLTGRETYLTSWRSADDPSPGEYTLRFLMVKGKYPQLYITRKNFSVIETRIGPYNGISFSGQPLFSPEVFHPAYTSYMVLNQDEMYFATTYINNNNNNNNATIFHSRTIVTPGGKLEISQQRFPNQEWIQSISIPVDYCDNYGVCGPYGTCNMTTSPYCGCLQGFERKAALDDTSGCRRRTSLDCGGPGDGFLKFSSMKLPDTENAVFNGNLSLQDCEASCINNCACNAYANPNITTGSFGCLLWFGDLIDVKVRLQNGQDLYVRLAASEFSKPDSSFHRNKQRVIMVATLSISFVLTLFGLLLLTLYIKRKWKKRSDAEEKEGSKNHMGSVEVPLFSLSKISRATSEFSVDNKLGEGGFGPVYKGMLEEGQEIAVKRLSKSSRQGLEEFKNEVICIAKLQHRNLVKLLGYCIQGDEKMLIYEYMPNKSLDGFLFDKSRKLLLDWPQRVHIIHGIARGLLYLHQDSRLKVVHRDLKAGNILLDNQMRPKISDFGLARMFKEDESEENTKRVVGTLGYISPEYAANGHFSIKSDVFSFGVLVLEIMSGKKNRGFVHEDHDDNLLGHAWRLHKEGKTLDLIDECLYTSYSPSEVTRLVHIGLLCVQQRIEDRPNTSNMVAMLSGEGPLPSPKKPGFFIEESEINSSTTLPLLPASLNGVTFTQLEGR